MKYRFNTTCIFSIMILMMVLSSCQDVNMNPEPLEPLENEKDTLNSVLFEVSRTLTNETLYSSGDLVELQGFSIKNSSNENVIIDSMWVEIGTASTNSISITENIRIAGSTEIEAGEEINIADNEISFTTIGFQSRGYLISLKAHLSSPDTAKLLDQNLDAYLTFFRISNDERRLTYDIEKEDYHGLSVYKLTGGLSAEYAVQKSAASINRGISHSWVDIDHPRQSTPDFLQRSLDKTVDFYNREFGKNKKFRTVIISTGITPISYISRTMDVPVLPLHFLIGAHTIKEIQTIMDFNIANDLPAYATYGHDYSLSQSQGVAWIKLLDLPLAYQNFLIDHQVEEIVFFGATSSGGGEKAARQVMNGAGDREPGSIYLMYFAGAQAEGFLKQVISDFDANNLSPQRNIADWESGIINQQITAISAKSKANTLVGRTVLITSPIDDIHLWNLATYSMLKFFKVNGITPSGVSLNPYLAGHPLYESYTAKLPFTYFNGIPGSFHITRVNGMLHEALTTYFPGIELSSLPFVANTGTRADFFSALVDNGYDVSTLASGDVWNIDDGINTPSEVRAGELLENVSPENLKIWGDNLKYLTIDDFRDISQNFTEISITDK